jgi:CPA1 family monovalent cation:H+ antiporter
MLFGILAILVARAVGVYSTLPWLGKLPGIDPISGKQQFMVYWGGLRGAVAVALALSLPLELDFWYTIQSITYGVVLFSLLIQAPVSYPMLKYIKGI